MNTLLPYADFVKSAQILHDERLMKQRTEIVNILKQLMDSPKDGLHPAAKMWKGNEQRLIDLGMACCIEHAGRGNIENMLKKVTAFREFFPGHDEMPEWFGDERLHSSHKSFLLRLRPTYYRRFWNDFPDDLAMMWPRSPEKERVTNEDRHQERLIDRAKKMKERAEQAIADAHDAAIKAGLDPDTMTPIADIEADPELAAL